MERRAETMAENREEQEREGYARSILINSRFIYSR